MNEEALWTIEFQTASGWTNGGVVVLETSKVFGGDSQYYYVGKYGFSGSAGMVAEVHVTHYSGAVGTAWGDAAQIFDVILRGTVSADGKRIDGTMERTGLPSPRFRMTRRELLP
jgi:hypothetical protein